MLSPILRAVLPMPPTDNDMYVPFKKKGKVVGMRLSDEARAYKKRVASVMADAAMAHPNFKVDDTEEYRIEIVVYFKAVRNAGWPEKAKTKFKKIDAHNRLKLVVDSVMECIGLDDCHIFEQTNVKQCDPDNPRVEVEVQRLKWV